MKFDQKEHSFDRAWQSFTFSTWMLAPQADGAALVSIWENTLLVTTVMERNASPDRDFMPLGIDRKDYFPAAGKIGGGQYRKREWRPSDNAVLYARMTDRALRPLFPKWMVNDTVITITPMQIDKQQDLWVLSIIGSSLTTMLAWIPFAWPVWAVRIWYIDGEFVINPTGEQRQTTELNLLVAWPKWLINMIECDAKQVPESILLQAFELGQQHIDMICDQQTAFLSWCAITPKTIVVTKPSKELLATIATILPHDMLSQLFGNTKVSFNELFSEFQSLTLTTLAGAIADSSQSDVTQTLVKMWVFQVVKDAIRKRTLDQDKRIDDRDSTQIRPLLSKVWLFKRTHGSGLFWRWDTQVLSTVTLWAPWDVQVIDSMEDDQVEQRYMHHYNCPWYSVNEAKMSRWPWRREVWHGALAEKALEHVLPSKVDFPYTMRVVSECLASWGSTSQASVCASTLALLDAWVPLQAPVAWIAMWLMTEYNGDTISKYSVLTDLMWTEDFVWDMDFKVAWTKTWVTAIQLDTKIVGLTSEIIQKTIADSKTIRDEILDFMGQTIATHRSALSPFAPKMSSFQINPDKVREVIGKWWETIDKIIEKANWVKIDFQDDGTVFISDMSQENIDIATKLIKDIAEDLPLKKPLDGKVIRVEQYGIFVSLPKWKSGLVHGKSMWPVKGRAVEQHFKVGDTVTVIVQSIDSQGRLVLELPQ